MSHADVEAPDSAIVARLAAVLQEARDLADLIVIRSHLHAAAGPWLQQVILGAINAHQAAEGAAQESEAPLIHRARMLGDYIWTYGGGRFYPQDPKPEEVNLDAIAHALSLKCRWTGHPKRLYSIGEHSLHVAEIAAWSWPSAPEIAVVYALLHDAHEYVLPDVARPVAAYLDATLTAMKQAVQEAILDALGLQPPSPGIEAVVRDADLYALRLEAEVLFPHEDHDPDAENCNLRGIEVPLEVREQFPVWGGEAPTSESIADQWKRTLTTAIEAMRERKKPAEVERWQDAAEEVEAPESCMVCLREGRSVPSVQDGLCGECLNG